MIIDFKNMCSLENKKAQYLLKVAIDLGMDLSGFGGMGVNQNSGNVYLWLEDYNFCLFMPINCELKKSDVQVCWTNFYNGNEEIINLGSKKLGVIENWAIRLSKKADEGE